MHPHTIFVTSLFDMPHYVRELAPTRVVSIIQPDLQPPRPEELAAAAHLRVGVHDISEYQEDRVLAEYEHIEELVRFVDSWDPGEGALLTHCYAGVSRSTATALIAAVIKTGDPTWSAIRLRAAAPHARPNRRIIALADQVLGLDGELIDACEAMSDSIASLSEALQGPLTVLRIGDEQHTGRMPPKAPGD
jgi:predicted protein tyrosine phosphatase